MSGRILASLLVLVCLFGAPFALTNVNACGNLNTAGETYVVTTDPLSSATVCLNISANNIILDCNGATIDYAGAGGPDHAGILVDGADGVTIRNCILTDWNYNGILVLESENLVMRNITTNKCYYGIHVRDGEYTPDYSSSFSIYGSNIGFGGIGIYTYGGVNSALIEGCDIDGGDVGTDGIVIAATTGTIRHNVIHDLSSIAGAGAPFAIRLSGNGNEYNVYNNTIYNFANTASPPGSMRGGIFLENGVHNSFVWNNTIYGSSDGWALIDRFNFATDNTFHSNIAHDVYGGVYCTGSAGHTSYNNSIWNVENAGISSRCDGASIHNNSVRNSSATAFFITGEEVEVYDNTAFGSVDGFIVEFPGATGWISVHDNIAHSNINNGFQLEGGGSAEQTYELQDNLAWNNSLAGFWISPTGAFPVMTDNTARNNTIGVFFSRGTGGNFADCDSYENQVGVAFSGTGGTIYNCDIYDNTNMEPLGGTGTGVVFQESYGNEVVNSRIDGNDIGVFINDSELDTIYGCDITANDRQGVWITGNAFSTSIINTDSHDNLGGTPPTGLYMDAEGNYPNLTLRNVRLFGNAGVELDMRNFIPSADLMSSPAFIIEDSIIYGGMQIIAGSSGEITDTYFKSQPRTYYFQINAGGPPAAQAIEGTNLGVGLPDSEAALGVGADTTRYAYIVYPAISLKQVTLEGAVMGTDFASLDASGAAAEMDTDAQVHLKPNSCNALKYYFLDGYPITFADIVDNGAEFAPTSSACAGGWATFAVDHFTGYAAEGAPSEGDGGGEDYECITNADCSGCEFCQDHECILPAGSCNTANDCSISPSLDIAPSELFICEGCSCIPIECTTDKQCDEGYACVENVCIPPECIGDDDCAKDEICVDFECQGKGGAEEEEEPGTGESGEPGNVTPEQPPEEKPPLITPVEIGESVIPLVEPSEEGKQEEWGIWQTLTTAAAFVIGMLILGAIIYFIAAKKKKKKRKADEAE